MSALSSSVSLVFELWHAITIDVIYPKIGGFGGVTAKFGMRRLPYIKYLMLIVASSDNHNLRLGKQSSYSTTFSCPFGRYRYI